MDNLMAMSFQDELIRLRKAAGLTQHQMAAKSKVKRSLLSHMELGIRPPQPDCLIQLADFFGLAGAERQRFIDLGFIAHMPEAARGYFQRLTLRVNAAEAALDSAESRIEILSKRK